MARPARLSLAAPTAARQRTAPGRAASLAVLLAALLFRLGLEPWLANDLLGTMAGCTCCIGEGSWPTASTRPHRARHVHRHTRNRPNRCSWRPPPRCSGTETIRLCGRCRRWWTRQPAGWLARVAMAWRSREPVPSRARGRLQIRGAGHCRRVSVPRRLRLYHSYSEHVL